MNSKAISSRKPTMGRVGQSTRLAKHLLKSFAALLTLSLALVKSAAAQADSAMQQNHSVDMATTMRSNGKIYVVVAVLVIILVGVFLYLIRLDRKISRLEKND